MIHGGGWRTGDKANQSQRRQKATFFAGNGFVYVSVNYRLSPAVRHPAHVEDVAKALSWIVDHIASYGGDPKRIFLMGHSAGAHLAALVTADKTYLTKLGKSPAMLSGVFRSIRRDMIFRATSRISPTGLCRAPLRRSIWKRQAGMDPGVTHSVCAARRILPPFLVFYTDREASETISKEFVEALQKAKIPAAGFG